MATLSTVQPPFLGDLDGKQHVPLAGLRRTRFLKDEEVSFLFERCTSSSTLNERKTIGVVQMVIFYIRFKTTTSRLSRHAFIQAGLIYEPTCSPGARATNKEISVRVLQHQLRANGTLIFTVTALVVSACFPGATIYSDIKLCLKLLTTALTSAGCLDLSVSFAVHLTSDCSVQLLQQHLHGSSIGVIGGVLSTPTHVRSFPFTHVFAPLETCLAKNLGTNFPIFPNRAVVQREITKTIQKSQTARQAHE
jgi:hypothetical protein